MDASVAAYHMAFGPDGRLFMTAPGLASHDAVHVIDKEGFDENFSAASDGRRAWRLIEKAQFIRRRLLQREPRRCKITSDGSSAEQFLAGDMLSASVSPEEAR